MAWPWVTVEARRRAYRTCLCTVPWLVLGQPVYQRVAVSPSWEELRSGTSSICGWSFNLGWLGPDASFISSISLDGDHLWETLPCALCSYRTTVCSLQRQRTKHDANERTFIRTFSFCVEWKWSRSLLSWIEHGELALPKLEEGLKMHFFSLVASDYYRLHELIRRILGVVGGDLRGCLCSAGTQKAL